MKKIFFVVNDLHEFTFQAYLDKYLNDVMISVGQEPPKNPFEYSMVILWDYRKIISVNECYRNYIVFHSSNLPEGRGWAPIYHAFADQVPYYTITGVFAADKVDTGEVIVRARFRMRSDYTASFVRKWDEEIMIILIKKILEKYPNDQIEGTPQVGKSTYYKRRCIEDGEVNINSTIMSMLPHLRGSEKPHPTFFFYEGIKYIISVEPEVRPDFPKDLEISYKDDGKWIPV